MARTSKKMAKRKPKFKVSSKVKDHGNDPFVIRKTEEARKFLEKHPVPEELLSQK